ncbi:uncharacterized protein LOC128221272 isoform X1 [Mya arenaria]|uniref:uncharacterized protein LOC128221272 isoform X1 n=2 Tax=Mya arenaria TaxID=6604 RepID=UPI0022E3BD2D|nr:uncharacterized protein LOC128221272 isoform X1 [Mya arenaria]
MDDQITTVRRAIYDRIINVANNLENDRLGNYEVELDSILTYLTQVSYHEDVNHVIQLCLNALELLMNVNDINTASSSQLPVEQLITISPGGRGRPFIHISVEVLEFFIENGFTIKNMSSLLSVSEKTIKNRMSEFGLSVRQTYTKLSDEELMAFVRRKINEFPSIGYRSMRGHLWADGIKVTETRVRSIMKAVDPLGVLVRNALCSTYRIRRRAYSVRVPKALWHVDSNHKLIRWRFIFHGGIDGYSRLPVYIMVASDNTAETAYTAFRSGTDKYGIPERVRTDKGMENIRIAEFMLELEKHGLNSGSHITGRSVHNQRIERFWRELWDGCTKTYYEFFSRMEDDGLLDVDNEVHLLVLHVVFLRRMQSSIDQFVDAVSRRPLRTEHNRTPLQLWISGQLEDRNHHENLSAEDLELYGVDFDCNEPVCDNPDIVVHPLLELNPDLITDIRRMADRTIESPFEVQTFIDILTYLSNSIQ